MPPAEILRRVAVGGGAAGGVLLKVDVGGYGERAEEMAMRRMMWCRCVVGLLQQEREEAREASGYGGGSGALLGIGPHEMGEGV